MQWQLDVRTSNKTHYLEHTYLRRVSMMLAY
jgi:hypothetical protein